MPESTEDMNAVPLLGPVPAFSRMLTLKQVREILNLKNSLVYLPVRSSELPTRQLGGRGIAGPGD